VNLAIWSFEWAINVLTPGAKLAQYETDATLGAGGMGRCAAGIQRLKREVALKILARVANDFRAPRPLTSGVGPR
jgi:hypothetical protein